MNTEIKLDHLNFHSGNVVPTTLTMSSKSLMELFEATKRVTNIHKPFLNQMTGKYSTKKLELSFNDFFKDEIKRQIKLSSGEEYEVVSCKSRLVKNNVGELDELQVECLLYRI